MNNLAVPRKKCRLVGLACPSSIASSSQAPYTDPKIVKHLRNKDARAVPRKKYRLVGLACPSSIASSSQAPYTDPKIVKHLRNKDARVAATET
ncbi:hypothetical protein F2Q70_00038476 [Brassica cretica]|uniref:Uncharacterized protein n=1 Tax=Brassica cretica TaxID=69181 RepID=A0A8S9K989_BRACR|nr:hypothetical protein F2Q70_00038476 [Brassica cretica]